MDPDQDPRTHLDILFTLSDDGLVRDFSGVGKMTPPKEGEKYGYFVEYPDFGHWLEEENGVHGHYEVLRITVDNVMPTAKAVFEAHNKLDHTVDRIGQICEGADDAELALEKIRTVLRGR